MESFSPKWLGELENAGVAVLPVVRRAKTEDLGFKEITMRELRSGARKPNRRTIGMLFVQMTTPAGVAITFVLPQGWWLVRFMGQWYAMSHDDYLLTTEQER